MPDAASHIWHWFWRLSSRRQSGMSSPMPISFRDVADFCSLTGEDMRPREVEVIEEMDAAWLKAVGDLQERNEENRKAYGEAKQKLKGK